MNEHSCESCTSRYSRRQVLQSGVGFGAVALASLLARDRRLLAAGEPAFVRRAHFRPRAKQVIFLFMSGGPSQVDTFDPKPELSRLHGENVPESIAKLVPRLSRGSGMRNLLASPFTFKEYGQSGIPVSEILPHTAKIVDDLCFIRSMQHRNPVHGPGECIMLTGTALGDRPSLGAWITYGLGSENDDLPWFVAMNANVDAMQFPQAPGWESGFLPPRYQGTIVSASEGIRNISMPANCDDDKRRQQLALLEKLNDKHRQSLGGDSELEARIRSYELAFKMQSSAPHLFDLKSESADTIRLYGADQEPTALMGQHCLVARRLIEAGVRFVQIRFGGWDAHKQLEANHRKQAAASDQPVAALITDLKQRGLLDDTLVIWGGEFGRTPTMENNTNGRDHSPTAFTYWLAGGGVRRGHIIGRTDDIGYTPTERPVRPSDFHATLLHALGLNQHDLHYNHHGRKELVTVLGGDVVQEVFA
jgi:hypothetical protein